MSFVIMGIDPASFKNMGVCIAVSENSKIMSILERKTFVFDVNKDNKNNRFIDLYNIVDNLIKKYKVKYIAFERTQFGKFFVISQIYESIGVIKLLSQQHGCILFPVSPMSAKKIITGSGKGTKSKMMEMVCKIFKINKSDLSSDHEADAIAMAYYCDRMILKKDI